MALATQCPHCQTTFRVAHDQLKLRAGLVRCGACKQIFNGIEHLLRPEDAAQDTASVAGAAVTPAASSAVSPTALSAAAFIAAPAASSAASSAVLPAALSAESNASNNAADAPKFSAATDHADASITATSTSNSRAQIDEVSPDDVPLHEASPHSIAPSASVPPSDFWTDDQPVDPLQRMTLVHFSDAPSDDPEATDETDIPYAAASTSNHQSSDELDQAIDYLQRKPWRGGKKSVSREDIEGGTAYDNDGYHASEEPGFITRSKPRRTSARAMWLLRLSTAILILTAVGQALYFGRDQLAARLPSSKPWLEQACRMLACQIALPAQVDSLSIESSELTTLNATQNTFALNLLLRNRSELPQRWPSIELTLLDASDRAVVRRVFTPADYLSLPSTTEMVRGFQPNSEQAARIAFELRQQKAANYRAYLFYP